MRGYWTLQRRLFPHIEACSRWLLTVEPSLSNGNQDRNEVELDENEIKEHYLGAIYSFGMLYTDQGKLDQAEEMHIRALQGREEALGPKHTSTLNTVNNLGLLYRDQGKLDEAETMYTRALQGREDALGPKHTSTLNTVNNLGMLYKDQGKLDEAETMYKRALQGKEDALGPKHT